MQRLSRTQPKLDGTLSLVRKESVRNSLGHLRGFTLVELLVVIGVIGLLVAILLPAVSAARAAARKTQCSSNKRQVALAVLSYESASGTLPPILDKRFQGTAAHRKKEVGWRFTILPFLEEQALSDLLDDDATWYLASRYNNFERDDRRPPTGENPLNVSVYRCPSDPEPPWLENAEVRERGSGRVLFDAVHPADFVGPTRVSNFPLQPGIGQTHPGAWWAQRWFYDIDIQHQVLANYQRDDGTYFFVGASLRRVTDGLSATVLLAEQAGGTTIYQPPEEPRPKPHWAAWILTGGDGVNLSVKAPVINVSSGGVFSFHNGAHVAMCDGAVRFLSEDISPRALGALIARNDGLSIDDEL